MISWHPITADGLDPAFAQDLNACVGPLPFDFRVTSGRRTHREQAVLYAAYQVDPANAPRAARPGQSAHESGLAVDLTLVIPVAHGALGARPAFDEWNYDAPGWQALYAAVANHPRLHSLWKIGDGDHVEAVNWRARAG